MSWPSGAVNVCDDEPAVGWQWLPTFCAAVGAPVPSDSAGTDREGDAEPVGDAKSGAAVAVAGRHGWARGADNRHAREELGWTPSRRSWRDGFADR